MSTIDPITPASEAPLLSGWIEISQHMIEQFGAATLDPDPMHVDPPWARRHSPFGQPIAFGFLTMSLLTRLLHDATQTVPVTDPQVGGVYLNYGFDRLRLLTPVPSGCRVRGRFSPAPHRRNEQGHMITAYDCEIEIEGQAKPALSARWLFMWISPETRSQ